MNNDFSEIELRKLDLNLLLAFAAVIRTGSAQGAAERLGVGASAISMALARLRDGLGLTLFERTASGLAPTPAAEAFWERVAPALGAISEAALATARFDPASTTETFRLGLPDDLSPWLAPRIAEALATAAPQARLVLRQSDFRRNLQRLDAGEAHLALGASPRGTTGRHRVAEVRRETFALLFDPAMFSEAAISLETYIAADHLLLSPAGDLEGPIDAHLRALGLSRRVAYVVEHFALFPRLLRGRRLIAAMPAAAAALYAGETGLARSPVPVDIAPFPLSWHWSARVDTDPAHRWFRDLAARALDALFASIAPRRD